MRYLIEGIHHCAFNQLKQNAFPTSEKLRSRCCLSPPGDKGCMFIKLHDVGNCSCLLRTRGLYRTENQARRKSLNFESFLWVVVWSLMIILLLVTLRLKAPRSFYCPFKFLFSFLNKFILQTWELHQ